MLGAGLQPHPPRHNTAAKKSFDFVTLPQDRAVLLCFGEGSHYALREAMEKSGTEQRLMGESSSIP